MRKVLEETLKTIESRKPDLCFEDHEDCKRCEEKNDLCWLEETARDIRRVLDKPLRNCDVGTSREQAARFRDHCAAHKDCDECPAGDTPSCALAWSQLPYTNPDQD